MVEYVIFQNDNGTESGLCLLKAFEHHSKDVDGNPMTKVKVFTASSWELARSIYNEWLLSDKET